MAQNIDHNTQDNIINNILNLHTNNRVAVCAFRNKLERTIGILEQQIEVAQNYEHRADIRIKITFLRTLKIALDIIITTRYTN